MVNKETFRRTLIWIGIAIAVLYISTFVGFLTTKNNADSIRANGVADVHRGHTTDIELCNNLKDTRQQLVTFLHDFAAIASNPAAVTVLDNEADKFQQEISKVC